MPRLLLHVLALAAQPSQSAQGARPGNQREVGGEAPPAGKPRVELYSCPDSPDAVPLATGHT
eukprot:scaffold51567_cov64-Phaeocystis_antarctica.AAC.2